MVLNIEEMTSLGYLLYWQIYFNGDTYSELMRVTDAVILYYNYSLVNLSYSDEGVYSVLVSVHSLNSNEIVIQFQSSVALQFDGKILPIICNPYLYKQF